MIVKPTVLVLGAGASQPFGYPTGGLLKNIICDYLTSPNSKQVKELEQLGYSYNQLEKFKDSLFKSSSPIDIFLENRKEYIDIGKIAIVQALIEHENIDSLFSIGDWYNHLFQKMSTSFNNFHQNNLSIVTFNYDRSLECYLFTTLKNLYDKSDKVIAKKLESIPIIHLHGQMGYLPWQQLRSRDYSPATTPELLEKSSKSIRIIHEVNARNDKQFNKARESLNKAERIYFLGFGYHPTNLKRLRIQSLNTKNKKVSGTAYGLTENERIDIQNNLTKDKIHLIPHSRNQEVLLFLKENVTFE